MDAAIQANAERVCPVCGGCSYLDFVEERIDPSKISDFTYASRKQPEFMCLRLVRCLGCDLVYAPALPATDFLSIAYSEAAYDSGIEAQAAARSYAKALAPHLAGLERKAAVDVGAGNGSLLPWLSETGFNPVIGIEPSRAAIEAALATVRPMLREGMFSQALLADIQPSLICSFMTLEHLANPDGFVRSVYEILEPGGMIAVVVHNWRAPLNRLLGLHSPIIDVEHLQLFNPQSVRTLLERSSFDSINILPIGNSYPIRYWLRLAPLPIGLKVKITSVLDCIGISNVQASLHVGNMLAVGIKPLKRER
jgi:SAM-dependent methyltransferase